MSLYRRQTDSESCMTSNSRTETRPTRHLSIARRRRLEISNMFFAGLGRSRTLGSGPLRLQKLFRISHQHTDSRTRPRPLNTHRRVSRTLQSRFFVRIALLLQDWLDVSTTVSCEMARRSPQFSEEVSGDVRARFQKCASTWNRAQYSVFRPDACTRSVPSLMLRT